MGPVWAESAAVACGGAHAAGRAQAVEVLGEAKVAYLEAQRARAAVSPVGSSCNEQKQLTSLMMSPTCVCVVPWRVRRVQAHQQKLKRGEQQGEVAWRGAAVR